MKLRLFVFAETQLFTYLLMHVSERVIGNLVLARTEQVTKAQEGADLFLFDQGLPVFYALLLILLREEGMLRL